MATLYINKINNVEHTKITTLKGIDKKFIPKCLYKLDVLKFKGKLEEKEPEPVEQEVTFDAIDLPIRDLVSFEIEGGK